MTKIGKIKTIKKLGMRCISCFLPFVLENLIEQGNGDMVCKKCNQNQINNVENVKYKRNSKGFL
jgi:hypothetical protein